MSMSPLGIALSQKVVVEEATAFAPANIALVKYWGKRDSALNLPTHSSLSLSLGKLGTSTRLRFNAALASDQLTLNGKELLASDPMLLRMSRYLDLFRPSSGGAYEVISENSVPTAAGLASSASAFAALARALSELHGWQLTERELSILARVGSGSAARSLFQGFSIWHAGERPDGLDSFAEGLEVEWKELGWLIVGVSDQAKAISSREAMERARLSCPWFSTWLEESRRYLPRALKAIEARSLSALGEVAEASTLAMHATMIGSHPAVLYWKSETITLLHAVYALRKRGLEVYFTMDAGPHVKILYRRADQARLALELTSMEGVCFKKEDCWWIDPWASAS